MVEEAEFVRTLSSAVSAVAAQLCLDGSKKSPVPVAKIAEYEFPGGSPIYRVSEVEVRQTWQHLASHWSELSGLGEVVELNRLLVDLSRGGVHHDFPGLPVQIREREGDISWRFTRPCVLIGLEFWTGPIDLERKSKELWDIVSRIFPDHDPTYRYTAPLVDLEMAGCDRIGIDRGVWLRRLTAAERSNLASGMLVVGPRLDPAVAARTLWAIEGDCEPGPVEEPIYTPEWPNETVARVLSALRIVTDGTLSTPGYSMRELPDPQPDQGFFSPVFHPGFRPAGIARIEAGMVPEFTLNLLTIYSSLKAIRAGTLRVAVARLDFLNDRVLEEDKLLDACISLEAALLGDNSRGELRYRFAQRGCLLLEDSPEARKGVKEKLLYVYELRSKIVHGAHLDREVLGAPEVESLARSVLRRLIPLARRWGHDAVLGRLDDFAIARASETSLEEFIEMGK